MAFYEEMAAMALSMITGYGQAVTFLEVVPGEYDPASGTTSPGAESSIPAQGILIDYTGRERQANSLIGQGDKKLKVAAQGLAAPPSLGSQVLIQGETWSIIPPLLEVNPAGTPILYELQVRK